MPRTPTEWLPMIINAVLVAGITYGGMSYQISDMQQQIVQITSDVRSLTLALHRVQLDNWSKADQMAYQSDHKTECQGVLGRIHESLDVIEARIDKVMVDHARLGADK